MKGKPVTDFSDVAQFVRAEDIDNVIAEATKFPIRRGMTEEEFVNVCIERAGDTLDNILTLRFGIGLRLDFDAAATEFLSLAGPRPTVADQVSDWEDLFDGHLEAVLAPQIKMLSQDWIGSYLTGTDFDDGAIRNKAADAGAAQIINYLNVTGTTSAKRLSAIGIARSTFASMYKPDAQPVSVETAAAAPATNTADVPLTSEQIGYYINDLVERMVIHHEPDVSNDATLGVIVNDMTDSDDGLAFSRIQVMHGDTNHFVALRGSMKLDTVAVVRERLINAVGMRLILGPTPSGAVVPPSAPVSVATPAPGDIGKVGKGGKRTKAAKVETVVVENGKALEALKLLRLHGSDSDDKLGQALGVSRGTIKNWADGKSKFEPTETQRAALKQIILAHHNGLQLATVAIYE